MTPVDKTLLSKAWYRRGKRGLVKATGHSMQPLIRDGTWLVVYPCGYHDVQPGDIALFHQNDCLVAHRIIFKQTRGSKMYLCHKGDNDHNIHAAFSSGCLMGKVVRIEILDGSLNLEQGYWRLVKRSMGLYWIGLWKTFQWMDKKEAPSGNTVYFIFSILNRLLLQFIVRLGYWTGQGIDEKTTWNQLAYACIASNPTLPPYLPAEEKGWEKFLITAQEQKIQGLCYKHLKRYKDRVPDYVISRLAKSSYAVGFSNLKILAEAANLVKTLEKAEIKVILLKGIAIHASQVYSNPAQRYMIDIDMLVKQQDLPRIETALQDMGYIPFDNFEKTNLSLEWFRLHAIEIGYHKPGLNNKMVDIHWSIDQNLHIPIQELWQRSRKLNLNGVEITVLSLEDMLLHLSVHTVFHHSLDVDLRHWADFARVSQLSLNWSQIISHAHKYRIERVLYIAFYLSQKFAGAQIPQKVLTQLQQACPRMLVWWLEKQTGLMQFQNPIFATWRCLWFIRGWHSKIGYLGSVMFRTGSVVFPPRRELSSLYDSDPDSWWAYFKYLLIYQKYIWGRALMKRIACLKR